MIPARVCAVIAEELGQMQLFRHGKPEVKPEHSLADDLGCGTIDRVCISIAIEEEFGITIDDETAAGWATVADVIACVEAGRAA